MKLIDVHAHLEVKDFEKDLDKVIENARTAGVKMIIASGVNPSTNRKVLEISEKYDLVKVSFGLYPLDAISNQLDSTSDDAERYVERFDVDEELAWIEENADKCVAIGEVGLDYKVVEGKDDLQKEVFEKIIALAKKIDKPLIIHSRKAELDAIDMLESAGVKKVVMHCFCGKKSLIKRCVELGWFFSVPPKITILEHFKMMVELVPLEQLLTETDAPLMSPVVGERNEPANVAVTIKEIAKIKGLSEEKVSEQIFKNAEELFGL